MHEDKILKNMGRGSAFRIQGLFPEPSSVTDVPRLERKHSASDVKKSQKLEPITPAPGCWTVAQEAVSQVGSEAGFALPLCFCLYFLQIAFVLVFEKFMVKNLSNIRVCIVKSRSPPSSNPQFFPGIITSAFTETLHINE